MTDTDLPGLDLLPALQGRRGSKPRRSPQVAVLAAIALA
jgi:hypothetical protein